MSDYKKDRKSIFDPRYKSLISYLSELRKSVNVSQMELAVKLNLSQSDISKIESCERRIDFIETIDWLRALGLDINTSIIQLMAALNGTK